MALASIGHKVMVVTPRYNNYERVDDVGLRVKVKVGGRTGTEDDRGCQEEEAGLWLRRSKGVDWIFVDHPLLHAPSHYGKGASSNSTPREEKEGEEEQDKESDTSVSENTDSGHAVVTSDRELNKME